MAADPSDPERDRLTGRVRRFAQVGTGLAGAGVAYGASRLTGADSNANNAKLLKQALGGLKGPLMKAAQMFATVPDFLPPEYAAELAELQTNAPSMGRPFVKRRMASELGPDWAGRFKSFDLDAAHAASLGQVHRATALDGQALAVKLQYPEMASAVETDVSQLKTLLALFKRGERAIDPTEALEEIAARLREELDYELEAKHIRLYRSFFEEHEAIVVPEPRLELSTKRLLSMGWLDGQGLLAFKTAPLEVRNRIAALLFKAWWAPMTHMGVIHGDPHLGNYSFTPGGGRLNLLDFGCVRIFPPVFVAGVVRLYQALLNDDREEQYAAYRTWGFDNLNDGLVDALNVWARFIYGPLLDDRVRTVADGVEPGAYGRREAFRVRQALKEKGPILIPREFVFMDRAAIGLGAAFLHLGAELNWKSLFDAELEGFSEEALAARQETALKGAGLR